VTAISRCLDYKAAKFIGKFFHQVGDLHIRCPGVRPDNNICRKAPLARIGRPVISSVIVERNHRGKYLPVPCLNIAVVDNVMLGVFEYESMKFGHPQNYTGKLVGRFALGPIRAAWWGHALIKPAFCAL
jgi:hypothetical protein